METVELVWIGVLSIIIVLISIFILLINNKTKQVILDMEKTNKEIKKENIKTDALIAQWKELDIESQRLRGESQSLQVGMSGLLAEISNKVDSDQIIEQINQGVEDIRIKGSLIEIDSKTIIEHGAISTVSIDPKNISAIIEKTQRKRRRRI